MKASTKGLLIAGGISVLALTFWLILKPKKANSEIIFRKQNEDEKDVYTPSTPKVTDTRLVGTNKHGKKWLCNDFEVRNGEWWVKSLDCKVKDCFATHYLNTLNNLSCK